MCGGKGSGLKFQHCYLLACDLGDIASLPDCHLPYWGQQYELVGVFVNSQCHEEMRGLAECSVVVVV